MWQGYGGSGRGGYLVQLSFFCVANFEYVQVKSKLAIGMSLHTVLYVSFSQNPSASACINFWPPCSQSSQEKSGNSLVGL